MHPGVTTVAIQRFDVDLLAAVELCQRFGEQLHRVVRQCCRRLMISKILESKELSKNCKSNHCHCFLVEIDVGSVSALSVDPVTDDVGRFCFGGVDHPQSGDVGAAVFVVFQVDGVQVQRRDEERIRRCDQTHLLSLLQDGGNVLGRAVQHEIFLVHLLNVFEQSSVQ